MKIGILTHHYVKNYGAYLQMKGLYETLRSVYSDDEVVVVNYVKQKHLTKNLLHILHFRPESDTVSTYLQKVGQMCTFTKYERSLPRTKRVYNAAQLSGLGLDLLILGSDEIWNLCGSGYHPMKFGCGLERMRTIAYAPSVGAVADETPIPEEIKGGLAGISLLSGRDEQTLRFLKRAANRSAVKMLDPTFLYNFDPDLLAEGVRPQPFPYIVIYDCKLTEKMAGELREYAAGRGYKILGAGDYKKYYDMVSINLTPYQWVGLIKYAEKVVTGTFHGTAFSVKYNKDVLCYPTEKNRINKIGSLLSDLRQEDRLLAVGNEAEFIPRLDQSAHYEYANEYIRTKQAQAHQFLRGERIDEHCRTVSE